MGLTVYVYGVVVITHQRIFIISVMKTGWLYGRILCMPAIFMELTEEFKENIIAETKDNVKRLCNHASLGLWCGNNEWSPHGTTGVVSVTIQNH